MSRLQAILYALLFSFRPALVAQAPHIEQVPAAHGLSSSQIYSLFQDRQGFLWVGTLDGLNRYDGHNCKVFKYAPDDPYSIAGNVIPEMYEDRKGDLWVGANVGISRYVRETEQFISYYSIPEDTTALGSGPVSAMYEDEQGRFWVATSNSGLHEMDRVRGTFRRYIPGPEYRDETLFTSPIHPDAHRKNHFWIAMKRFTGPWEIFSFNTEDRSFKKYGPDAIPLRGYVWNILEDRDGILWFVASNGLYPFDPKSGAFLPLDGLPDIFKKMNKAWLFGSTIDPEGQFWLGTGNDGLYVLDKNRGLTAHYGSEMAGAVTFGDKPVKVILHDRSGVAWAGSLENGLFRIAARGQPFRHVLRDTIKALGSLTANSFTAFLEDRSGRIWAGTDDNCVMLFDTRSMRIENPYNLFPGLEALKNFSIYSLGETRDGSVWIGTNSQGLIRCDPVQQALTRFRHNETDSTTLSGDYVHALLEDQSGALWAGTFQGLDRYDANTGRFEHFRQAGSDLASQYHNYIKCLYEDRNGNIWAGTLQGLALLNRATRDFSYFLQIRNKPKGNLPVNSIWQDHSGVLWAGTGVGLYRLNFPNPADPRIGEPAIRRYTETDGLPNRCIVGVLEDDAGRLWLSTQKGLSVLRNPNHGPHTAPDFKNFYSQDGLRGDVFRPGVYYKSRSGLFFFGGINGFHVFHPDSIRDNPYRPPVVFTAFEKFDTDRPEAGAIPEKGISARSEIVLFHTNNIFTIEFAALDFREPAANRYAYRLLGFSDAWVQLGNQRRVTFTNLDPGTYTFQVKGTNSDGIWNETPTELKIVVRPPWWKTGWAYGAYIMLLIAALFGVIKARVRYLENRTRELETAVVRGTAQILDQKEQLEKQAGELQELDRLKSRFYANITHELRTPLTLMLGPLGLVLKKQQLALQDLDLLKIAQQNGQKLLRLVSEILDLGKLDANKMALDEKPTQVLPLLKRLIAQFDSHAGYLEVQLNFSSAVAPELTVMLDAKKVETVVNNLMSNALKFTPSGGKVDVSLREQTDTLLLAVQDSGRGIHADDQPHIFDRYFQTKRPDTPVEGGTGIGLALSAELVRLAGGRIWVESTPGLGSTFFVEWPKKEVVSAASAPVSSAPPPPLKDWGGAIYTATSATPPFSLREEAGGEEEDVRGAVPKILIAEDNPDLQQYLHHILAPAYDLVMTGNGEAALALLRDEAPALIISDIMMPRMDGFQLLEHLKADDRYRHIPVVMLTARADIQDKLRALRIGVDDYLTKPFEEEELLARVENLLQRQQNRLLPQAGAESAVSEPPRMSQADADWLSDLEAWTRANLKDEFLNVGALARQAALSERQLLRRLQELTGLSPQQYIAELRLQRARDLLERGAFRTVAEAAYATGFGHAKVFTRAYRARFGRLPSSYF